jgi:hypothetical protein
MSCMLCGDGEGAGVGVAAGICMPGMFSICCGAACCVEDGDGEEAGAGFRMSIPGMFPMSVLSGDGEVAGECDGMGMPFMFMPPMSCFFGAGRALFFRRAAVLAFAFDFRLALGLAFGFDMSMPGMFCMLCPRCCARVITPAVSSAATASAHSMLRTLSAKVVVLIIASTLE